MAEELLSVVVGSVLYHIMETCVLGRVNVALTQRQIMNLFASSGTSAFPNRHHSLQFVHLDPE